jgi:hypothetical protein
MGRRKIEHYLLSSIDNLNNAMSFIDKIDWWALKQFNLRLLLLKKELVRHGRNMILKALRGEEIKESVIHSNQYTWTWVKYPIVYDKESAKVSLGSNETFTYFIDAIDSACRNEKSDVDIKNVFHVLHIKREGGGDKFCLRLGEISEHDDSFNVANVGAKISEGNDNLTMDNLIYELYDKLKKWDSCDCERHNQFIILETF